MSADSYIDQKELQKPVEKKESRLNRGDVSWAESGDRQKNLFDALEASKLTESSFWNKIRNGGRILINLNYPDHRHEQTTTNPEALHTVAKELLDAGATEILIAALPCKPAIEGVKSSTEISDAQRQRYGEVIDSLNEEFESKGKTVRLIDLTTEPLKEVKPGLPKVYLPDNLAAIVNLAHPKRHGEYKITCSVKNMLGLVSREQISDYFHPSPTDTQKKELQQKTSPNLSKYEKQASAALAKIGFDIKQQDIIDATRAIAIAMSSQLAASEVTEKTRHSRLADFTRVLDQYWTTSDIEVLHVVDGEEKVEEQEQTGTLEKMGGAGVSSNPAALDEVTRYKAGWEKPDYLFDLEEKNPYRLKSDALDITAPQGATLTTSEISDLEISTTDKGTLKFEFRFSRKPSLQLGNSLPKSPTETPRRGTRLPKYKPVDFSSALRSKK